MRIDLHYNVVGNAAEVSYFGILQRTIVGNIRVSANLCTGYVGMRTNHVLTAQAGGFVKMHFLF